MMEFLGPMLSGLGSVIGGASSLFGGRGNNNFWDQMAFAREQLQFQRDAAQMGIRWRVNDAKEAGIHPLYAMGTPSFNPSPIGLSLPGGDGGPDVGNAISQMGQGLGRAISATQTKSERAITELEVLQAQQGIERRHKENQLLDLQIAASQLRLRKEAAGPPMPQVNAPPSAATNQFDVKPNEITSSQGDVPHAAAGPVAPSNQWRMAPDGTVYPTPEKNLQIDDMGSPGWFPWMYRNHVLPYARQTLGQDVQYAAPPKSYLPAGATHWRKGVDGGWIPVYPTVTDDEINRSRHNRVGPLGPRRSW